LPPLSLMVQSRLGVTQVLVHLLIVIEPSDLRAAKA
jgi:hypothetical protein